VNDNKVTTISKFFNPDIAYGEFVGIAKFSKKGAEILRRNYHRAKENKTCRFADNHRFHDARTFKKAYLTDMIQELIDRGYPIHAIPIRNGWVEIDTEQDFEYTSKLIREGKI
jgi:phosphoenolpyruvate phosphomutase